MARVHGSANDPGQTAANLKISPDSFTMSHGNPEPKPLELKITYGQNRPYEMTVDSWLQVSDLQKDVAKHFKIPLDECFLYLSSGFGLAPDLDIRAYYPVRKSEQKSARILIQAKQEKRLHITLRDLDGQGKHEIVVANTDTWKTIREKVACLERKPPDYVSLVHNGRWRKGKWRAVLDDVKDHDEIFYCLTGSPQVYCTFSVDDEEDEFPFSKTHTVQSFKMKLMEKFGHAAPEQVTIVHKGMVLEDDMLLEDLGDEAKMELNIETDKQLFLATINVKIPVKGVRGRH